MDQTTGFDLALNYLSYKNRTENEVADYLKKKRVSQNEITAIIEKLKYYDYVNDEKYLIQAVRINASCNQFGRLRLKQDLKQRGIDENVLTKFETIYSEALEVKCAKAQLEKAIKKYKQEVPLKRSQKIFAMLQRRGFPYGLITTLINEVHFENIEDDVEASGENKEELRTTYQKYYKMQSRKGYTGRELKQRVIRNLLSKGYGYDTIKTFIEENQEDYDGE